MVFKRGTKKANYVFRGGIIGFILSLMIITYRLYTSKLCFDGGGIRGECISELSIVFSSSLSDVYATYRYLIPEFILAIVVGALVGWIIGKIRNEKR